MNLLFIGFYLFLQLAISYWVSKKITSEKDFFIAGRSLPMGLLSFSLFATWFGAETCIGTSAAVFQNGLSGSRADPFGYSICLVLLAFFLATQLWKGGYTTLADFFKERFDGRVEKLAILIIVPSTLLWGGAQMRAFAQIVSSVSDWDMTSTLWIAFLFVTLYTLMGGLLGDIITDLIQGLMIAIGLSVLLYYILANNFDWSQWWENVPKDRLSFIGNNENLFSRLDRWAVPILGSLVAQELISRVLSARSARVAKNSALVSAAIYFIFGSIPVIIGLLGPELITNLNHPEDFMLDLAKKYLPPFAFVLFSGALISAILATIDSILLSSSALISHNIVVPLAGLKSEKSKLFSARLLIVISGLMTVLIASSSDSIYNLVQLASSFGTAGVLVITLVGLHTKIGNAPSAIAALIVGMVALPVLQFVLNFEAPFLATIGASFAIYFLFAKMALIPQKAN